MSECDVSSSLCRPPRVARWWRQAEPSRGGAAFRLQMARRAGTFGGATPGAATVVPSLGSPGPSVGSQNYTGK